MGADKAEAEEDLAGVGDSWSITIVEDQDTMPVNTLTQHIHRVNIVVSLIMR